MDFDRHSLAGLFVARFQRIVTAPVPLIASTARRPALWRWLVRRRVESVHSGERRQPKRVGRILRLSR